MKADEDIGRRIALLAELRGEIRVRHDPPPEAEADAWVLHHDQDGGTPSWHSRAELDAFWAARLPG